MHKKGLRAGGIFVTAARLFWYHAAAEFPFIDHKCYLCYDGYNR